MEFLLQTSLSYILQTTVDIYTILIYFQVHIFFIRLIYYSQVIFILKSSLTFSILYDHIIYIL